MRKRVTLAYNSAQLLPAHLDSLLRQSRSLEEIIVVNNGSCDGTLDVLSARYPQVTVLNLPSNLGAGGGYAEGLEYAALRKKHDWVWLLDHDSIPRDDGLATLLHGLTLVEGPTESIGILAPSPVHLETQTPYPSLLWRRGWVRSSSDVQKPVCLVDAVISSGSLVRREVVEQTGVPRADFFIDFVDFEYCLRAGRHGYKIVQVRDSLLDHAMGDTLTVRVAGFVKIWTQHAPWREYYISRNETFIVWNHYPDWRSKMSTLLKLVRHAAAIVAFGTEKRACLKMMMIGFMDGKAGRLGIRFLANGATESGEVHGALLANKV